MDAHAINDLEFKSGTRLLPQAMAMARKLAALKARVQKAAIPVIYFNDSFRKMALGFLRPGASQRAAEYSRCAGGRVTAPWIQRLPRT